MRDDGVVSAHDRPVDPLIARRDASLLDLTPPRGRSDRARGRRPSDPDLDPDAEFDLDDSWDDLDRGHDEFDDRDVDVRGPAAPDGTDGFGLFDDEPEPVAAWDRSPATPRSTPPQLKVLAAIVGTVAVIWAIVALRGPSDDGSQETTSTTTMISAAVTLGTVQQNAGTTTVEATISSDASAEVLLSNHVWIVRDGEEYPEAIAFIGCTAVDDVLEKPFSGTYDVVAPVNDAAACGVGSFSLAGGGSATVRVTALGLAPGAYRVLLAAWTSPPFTVA